MFLRGLVDASREYGSVISEYVLFGYPSQRSALQAYRLISVRRSQLPNPDLKSKTLVVVGGY
jgi:hypothetical protein